MLRGGESPMQMWWLLLTLLLAPGVDGFGEAQKYLIATSPATATIAYLKLPGEDAPADGQQGQMRVLIDSGLSSPQGIAVDEYRQMLYVADPGLSKLVRYKLAQVGDLLQVVGHPEDVATPVETRGVAVDGIGNVWFTDEPTQRILRVKAESVKNGNKTPQVMYDGNALESVRSPGGIALDNFFVYWLNKAEGETAGSLLRAYQNPAIDMHGNITVDPAQARSAIHLLANNAAKCYGVCIAMRNIFYTDESKVLYGVPRAATFRDDAVQVSNAFVEPRGCAFDGDSTVYVADKATSTIHQFASNFVLGPGMIVPMTKAAELQGAFGLAVYSILM